MVYAAPVLGKSAFHNNRRFSRGMRFAPHGDLFALNFTLPEPFRLVFRAELNNGVHCAHPFDAYFLEGGVLQRLWTRLFLPSLAL